MVAARFVDKTVVISGAARGQGRSHALRFASEGANLMLFDLCAQLDTVDFPMSTTQDLANTVEQASRFGTTVISEVADVRDWAQMQSVFDRARAELGGRVDVAVANAAIVARFGTTWEITDEVFRDTIDVNLIGSWHVVKAAILSMHATGTPGSIVVTGSGTSLKGTPNISPYVASKHALLGLVRSAAKEAAPQGIRINLVAPGNVNTTMLMNEAMYRLTLPDDPGPTAEMFKAVASASSPMGVPYVEPEDVTEAVTFLASDAARYITGVVLPVDGGSAIP